jgi:hypothetical protein
VLRYHHDDVELHHQLRAHQYEVALMWSCEEAAGRAHGLGLNGVGQRQDLKAQATNK